MPNYDRKPTPEEKEIARALDALYPKAKSRTTVDYEGKKYEVRYFPIRKTDDGEKVEEWGHRWVPIRDDDS